MHNDKSELQCQCPAFNYGAKDHEEHFRKDLLDDLPLQDFYDVWHCGLLGEILRETMMMVFIAAELALTLLL